MPTLTEHCEAQIAALEANHLRRTLRVSKRFDDSSVEVEQDGRRYVSFACNDYLGLRNHPEVIAAGAKALAEHGAGAGASRLITGNHPLYAPLENQLAKMKGSEAALVFGSGYLTNLGVIPALVGKGDVIFIDKLVHACIIDAAQLSGARLVRFRHNDMAHLESLLKGYRADSPNALIVTDHVFSMDGDVAPLAEIAALGKQYDAWTMADDAHGLGVVSAQDIFGHTSTSGSVAPPLGGSQIAQALPYDFSSNLAARFGGGYREENSDFGVCETADPPPNHAISNSLNNQHRARRDLAPPQGGSYPASSTCGDSKSALVGSIDIQMGTLSKAVGAYGGYVCGSKKLIDYLTTAARSVVFSTGLPPSVCASALAALEVMEREPERGSIALTLAQRVTSALSLPRAQSAIVPIILGEAEAALAASERLRERGILAVAIRPPTVPPGTARLRLAFSCEHSDAQVDGLIAALRGLV